MGIIANRGGIDLSKYIPISKDPINITNSATIDTYVPAYSISGKGFIDQITVYLQANGGGLRITIDGAVIFESYAPNYNKVLGIVREKYKLNNSSSAYIRNGVNSSPITSAKSYPFIDSTTTDTSAFCFLENPIFFNSSVLVETRSALASQVYPVTIKGGHL